MSSSKDVAQIKKVAIIGPECTGKSELSQSLAEHFQTVWIPEYARGYLDNLTRPYQEHDLLTIAHGQLRLEDAYSSDVNKVMICDTNLYVIKIWSQVKFGNVHSDILKSIETRKYDLYLLSYVDIPWEEDPQREHPDKRQFLFDLYRKEMENQTVPFHEIRGDRDQRRKTAIDAIQKLLMQ
jgi:NadR type nicotinamide-nucleotide adenylyltransferase